MARSICWWRSGSAFRSKASIRYPPGSLGGRPNGEIFVPLNSDGRDCIFRQSRPSTRSGVPVGADRRTDLQFKRSIILRPAPMPPPKGAGLGTRLRFLRQRADLTLDRLSQMTRLSRNALCRLEQDAVQKPNLKVLGRLLSFFADRLHEAFSEGDPYDQIIPPKTLGSWIRNQRLRRGMEQGEFARRMRVHVYSVVRYERDAYRPNPEIRRRLREVFGPGLDAFITPATISNGANGRPASVGSRTSRSRRHAQKKQDRAAVQNRKTRVRLLG